MQLQSSKYVTLDVLHPILRMKQRSLIKPTMNVKIISVLLKHHSRKDSGTKRDFKHQIYEKSTELSKYIWTFKSHGITPIVKWSIVKRVRSRAAGNYCKLCLTEKVHVIQSLDDKTFLNKKSEFVNKFGHQNKLLLRNVKRNYAMD